MHQLGPGEGTHHEARGSNMWFKATAASTGGRFSLMERTCRRADGCRPRTDTTATPRRTTCSTGRSSSTSTTRCAWAAPTPSSSWTPGAAHTFGNTSAASARLLVLHAPALDAYFADLAALWSTAVPPTKDDELGLMRRHGMSPA